MKNFKTPFFLASIGLLTFSSHISFGQTCAELVLREPHPIQRSLGLVPFLIQRENTQDIERAIELTRILLEMSKKSDLTETATISIETIKAELTRLQNRISEQKVTEITEHFFSRPGNPDLALALSSIFEIIRGNGSQDEDALLNVIQSGGDELIATSSNIKQVINTAVRQASVRLEPIHHLTIKTVLQTEGLRHEIQELINASQGTLLSISELTRIADRIGNERYLLESSDPQLAAIVHLHFSNIVQMLDGLVLPLSEEKNLQTRLKLRTSLYPLMDILKLKSTKDRIELAIRQSGELASLLLVDFDPEDPMSVSIKKAADLRTELLKDLIQSLTHTETESALDLKLSEAIERSRAISNSTRSFSKESLEKIQNYLKAALEYASRIP